MLQTLTIESQAAETDHLPALKPIGATAALIHRRAKEQSGGPVVHVAQTARRARDILALLRAFDPDRGVAYFPPWDCLPDDFAAPSRAVMGQRMSVLRWLTDKRKRPSIVLTTAEALIRRVPARSVWKDLHREFRVGETVDLDAVEAHLKRIGYVFDDRVDEPGEAAIRGRVVDFFPAAAAMACRIEHDDGLIVAIRSYDPLSQRSVARSDMLIVDPATEALPPAEGGSEEADAPFDAAFGAPGGKRETVFDYAPDAVLTLEDGADRRAADFFEAIGEAYGDELAGAGHRGHPEQLFLKRGEWEKAVASRMAAVIDDDSRAPTTESHAVPRFVQERAPWQALKSFAAEQRAAGRRLVFAAPSEAHLSDGLRRAERLIGERATRVATWDEATAAEAAAFLGIVLPLDDGFLSPEDGVAVVAARDVAGRQAAVAPPGSMAALWQGEAGFRLGDAVVHLDHGVAILEGIEETRTAGVSREALRLRYAGDATLIVPMKEIGALWRYSGETDGVTLDRLKGEGWIGRRNGVIEGIRATAERMIDLAKGKTAARTEPIRTDPRLYEQFCAQFPYELTTDQTAAVEAVLDDLAAGRPMDRLVCGDVGFGKTEVALRAAAAAVFAGRQVAIVAPTTVLAQQHVRLFRRRFAKFAVEVVQLSRLSDPKEAKAVKAGLRDGSVSIVVGTHAVAGKDVRFRDLALVVIDEEQRFGIAQKRRLRGLGERAHVLTMTATPIPRTLQAGFVGLHDLSIIATPPVLRRPVDTKVLPWSDESVREALLREKKREGQSFVVCSRIEDIEPMAARLRRVVPELAVGVAHGKLPAEDLDDAMLRFAGGEGDILLATNIIESGLDVPRANTMLVWRPDRFGLAQLHQLRGRVGRGARRGVAHLLTDPDHPLAAAAEKRIRTLEALNRLGAGFEISARDLDLRGAGDLLGEEQAGHLHLIGLSLYRHFLERALRVAEGQAVEDDRRPEVRIGVEGYVPPDYVPEDEMRIELYSRLDRAADALSLDLLEAEIEDRFGPLPRPLAVTLALRRLQLRARDLGLRRLDAGPTALAASFEREREKELSEAAGMEDPDLRWSRRRIVFGRSTKGTDARLAAAGEFLDRLSAL